MSENNSFLRQQYVKAINIEKLKNDDEFQNILTRLYKQRRTRLNFLNSTVNEINDLIKSVEMQINKTMN